MVLSALRFSLINALDQKKLCKSPLNLYLQVTQAMDINVMISTNVIIITEAVLLTLWSNVSILSDQGGKEPKAAQLVISNRYLNCTVYSTGCPTPSLPSTDNKFDLKKRIIKHQHMFDSSC